MSRSEDQPNWDNLVNATLEQNRRDQDQRTRDQAKHQQDFQQRQKLEAQAATNLYEEGIRQRTATLDKFHPLETLEGLNRTKKIWGGLGLITHTQSSREQTSPAEGWVEYSLDLKYETFSRWSSYDTSGVSESIDDKHTFIRIGVGRTSNPVRLSEEGKVFMGKDALYVFDSDVRLTPVEGANNFPRVGKPDRIYSSGQKVFFDPLDPEANVILIELLARSCIARATDRKLPIDLKREGDKKVAEGLKSGAANRPVQQSSRHDKYSEARNYRGVMGHG